MQTKETTRPVTWVKAFRNALTRHWREKILAVVIATLFWNMIKQQIRPTRNSQRDFIEEHSLGNAAGIEQHPVQ
ncbi:MAG: hypothetical protein JWO94_906 [Verrucomicrobiaceae bacterium]|nr:hypothetical protein [Verrucomicrobiaceae bacterium]